ncbi:hypothetical protein PWT90_00507 [Aphanocladium album]|nr:hypothetical protein PWT90_00507 [Aphanocladium album]
MDINEYRTQAKKAVDETINNPALPLRSAPPPPSPHTTTCDKARPPNSAAKRKPANNPFLRPSVADYYESIPSRPVLADVQPGYLRRLLPDSAPLEGEPMEAIAADIQSKIMPGITHWAHPGFMAFFACTASHPANIAEMWSNAFNGAHFNWICSPAVTELETVVMDWLAKALALPECYLSGGPTHGGGVLHGSASEAILTVMVAARDRYLAQVTAHLPEGGEDKEEAMWRHRSRMVALGSAGAHSSTKKAAQVIGVRFDTVPVDEASGFAMTGEALREKLAQLRARGLEPFYLTATMGTTDVCAVDDFAGIAATLAADNKARAVNGTHGTTNGTTNGDAAAVAAPGEVWVHVDAAFAGSALVCEEHQHLTPPLAHFHSFNFNPHKWLLTTFDCSAVWVRSRADLITSLSIKPHYLRNEFSDSDLVTDYRDWQIPLGRRFRSLKLWFVLRSYGLAGLREHVRRGMAMCESLDAKLRTRPDLFSIFTKARFALVSFRVVGADEDEVNKRTERLYETLNASGQVYLTSTVVNGKFAIRVSTSTNAVREEHVQSTFDLIVKETEALLAKAPQFQPYQQEEMADDRPKPDKPSASSSGEPEADKAASRKRRWAPKVRTGCAACRAQHRKCDEKKPTCGHCARARRECQYPLQRQPPPSLGGGGGGGVLALKKPLRPLIPAPKLRPIEPPNWDFTEAGRYYTPKKALLAPEQYDLSSAATQENNFIMVALVHRITTVCAHHRRPVRPGQLTGLDHLWKGLYLRMASAVGKLNEDIQNGAAPRRVLGALCSLLGAEMAVRDSPWRAHLQGCAAFIESYGGLEAILKAEPTPERPVQFGIVLGILSNTTSPVHDQLLGFHKYDDEQLLKVYEIRFFNLLPCPSALFIELQRITRLRVAVVTTPPAEIRCLVPVAMNIAKRVADFSPDGWTEKYDLPAESVRPLLARLFQDAIIMHAVLALPPVLGSLFGPGHKLSKTQRFELRERLLKNMEEAHKTYPRLDSLSWIVAVLGVAFHDGTASDKQRILVMVDALMGMPGVYSGPSTLHDRLQTFWSSGKSAWDDCFYSPTHVIA